MAKPKAAVVSSTQSRHFSPFVEMPEMHSESRYNFCHPSLQNLLNCNSVHFIIFPTCHVNTVHIRAYTLCLKRDPDIINCNFKKLTDFDDFWHKYSWNNWPSNGYSSSHVTQHLFLRRKDTTERCTVSIAYYRSPQVGLYTLCLRKKTRKLWNGVARNYKDRFWRHLAEIFKRL